MKGEVPEEYIRTAADKLAISQGAYWDQAEADKIIKFAHAVFRPQKVKGRFRLLQWQSRFLQSLYGWRWANGSRRFRYGALHIAKKAGKTLITSILCMYELLASGEASPTVYAAAASKENAEQIFNELRHSIQAIDPDGVYCSVKNHLKRITVPSLNGQFRTYASKGSSVHGDPANLVIIDEAHVVNQDLRNALVYNIDGTANGLCVIISTAGSDTSHWYHQTYQKSKRILAGEDLDTITYAEVYEADPKSDFEKDESQWFKANPSMGTHGGFPVEQFRRQVESAKGDLGTWLNFQRLKLNIWVRPDEAAWLDTSDWERYTRPIPDVDLAECEAVIGVDLSEVADPTSVSIVFDLGDRNYYVKSWCWVAEAGVQFRAKGTLPLYHEWIQAGHMTVTDGDMIDRTKVMDHIIGLCKQYKVRQVNFDPHSAYVLANDIEAEGYTVARMVQSARNFNGPMNEFSRAYKEGRIHHDGNTWLRYCLSNVRLEVNRYNEIRPFKRKSVDHIDGAISTLLGFVSMFSADEKIITTGVSC